MTSRWSGAVLAYTVVLWLAVLGCLVVMVSLPDSWSYDPENVPPLAILQTALWTLSPSLVTAALTLTVTTIALAIARTRPSVPAPADPADPWSEDSVLLTR